MSPHHLVVFLLASLAALRPSSAQSNYADQANSIEYSNSGLPEYATLDGKVTQLDELSPIISLNRTKAALNCAEGTMQIELKFDHEFYGLAYADFDRNSACQVSGKGARSYLLELPLKGCGTKQDPQRVFTNNIVVRFHPTLEMDGDEIITIVCRYPPPIAPAPPIANPIIEQPPAALPIEPPLGGFQILLIICAILFLSLLLLGLGCSYYCLRRRNMTVVRRHPFSSIGTESEITKISGSSLGNLSLFEGVKIPRAHAPVAAAGSSSGSEGPLISDTLPSDYPSESHSEPDDERSLPASSAGSYENKVFVPDYAEEAVAATKAEPKFDVQVRVKRSPPPPPSLTLSDTESSATERNLSTILEQREESVRSDSREADRTTHFSYVPEIHAPPKHIQLAPTFTRIKRKQQELHEEPPPPRARSLASLDTELTDTHSVTEMVDDSHRRFAKASPPPPPVVPKQQQEYAIDLEPPIAVVHKPEITSHVVDDVFLRTITEKRTIEDVERHKRLVTEYHARSRPPAAEDRRWDVTIKNYPAEAPEPPDWENFSDVSSASGLTLTPRMERSPLSLPPPGAISDNKLPLNSPELVGYVSQYGGRAAASELFLETYGVPPEDPDAPNWNVLVRVLRPTEREESEGAETFDAQLTHSDRLKWRQIITTESALRTLLTEAVVREDYERIRRDRRYEELFEAPKWDVILRILAPPDRQQGGRREGGRYRKRAAAEWDTRSRRSSLPTLYEYDSDGGGSAKTLTAPPAPGARKSSRSSYRSEADLRSMSEMIVDFGRHPDSQSEASSYYPGGRYYEEDPPSSLARSLSQPSLARSASEFTERWVAPSRYDTASECTTPEGTPRSQRSARIEPLRVPRGAAGEGSVWRGGAAGAPRGALVVAEEYRARASLSSSTAYRGPTKGWFADNDSEASFK